MSSVSKHWVLVALAVAYSKAQDSIIPEGVSNTSPNGWYAGDCLDNTNFSDYYGYVDFNCGENCLANYNGNGGSTTNPNNTDMFYSCYYDSYGPRDYTKAQECNRFAALCDSEAYCLELIYGCYDIEDYNQCMYDVLCNGVSTCETQVSNSLAGNQIGRRYSLHLE